MKRLLPLLFPLYLFSQDDLYPPESFYGGGVGFSQMFLFVDVGKLEGFELLGTVADTAGDRGGLGLDTDGFSYPFVVNGGEGFSNVTGRWRLGGYAGVGSSFISGKPQIFLFLDLNEDGVENDDTQRILYTNTPDLQAKISVWMGGATVEYAFPIFPGFEISAGVLLGIGRLNLTVSQSSGTGAWEDQFTSIYELDPDLTTYPVGDLNGDDAVDGLDEAMAQTTEYPSIAMRWGTTSLTGTFLNFQPYSALKLQFLDRVGLRLSLGFNFGEVEKGTWESENRYPISDSPRTQLDGLAVRAMLYFGL